MSAIRSPYHSCTYYTVLGAVQIPKDNVDSQLANIRFLPKCLPAEFEFSLIDDTVPV